MSIFDQIKDKIQKLLGDTIKSDSPKVPKSVDPDLPINEQIKQAGIMCRLLPNCPYGKCYNVPSSGFYCTCGDSQQCKIKEKYRLHKLNFSMEYLDEFIELYCVANSSTDFIKDYDIMKHFNPNGVLKEAALSSFVAYMVGLLTPDYEFSEQFFRRAIFCGLVSSEEDPCQYYIDIPQAIIKGASSKENAEKYGNELFNILENASAEDINSGAVPSFWHDYLREPSLYDRDYEDFIYTLVAFSTLSSEEFIEANLKDPSVVDLKQFYDSEGRIKPAGRNGEPGDTIYRTQAKWLGLDV